MYRTFKIEDESGDKYEFNIYPSQNNLIEIVNDEINMTLDTKKNLLEMISYVNRFMSGNTICKLDVDEEE